MLENINCTGCLLCQTVCPTKAIIYERDKLGFVYPQINELECIKCGTCERYCPSLNPPQMKPTMDAYYGFHHNLIKRKEGSSGGIFQALCEQYEEDVIVGCMLDLKEGYAQHVMVEKCKPPHNEINALYGSKYVQSLVKPEIYIKTARQLKEGKRVLFTGTPCQCAAVKKYMEQKSISMERLLLCEIMCHGAPAPMLLKNWIETLRKKGSLKNINFRSKKFGWFEPSYEIKYENGKNVVLPAESCAYHLFFGLHYSIRESCFHCQYRRHERVADLTIGDFWAIKSLKTNLPNAEKQNGISGILVNTEKGRHSIEKLQEVVILSESQPAEVLKNNTVQIQNFEIPKGREEFILDATQMNWDSLIKKYPPKNHLVSVLKAYLRQAKARIK